MLFKYASLEKALSCVSVHYSPHTDGRLRVYRVPEELRDRMYYLRRAAHRRHGVRRQTGLLF